MSNEVGPISEAPPVLVTPSAQPGSTGHGRAAFAFIFVTVALDMVALGIIIPVLPRLIVRFEHGDMAMAATQTGVFAFVWAAMQFVFAPVMGALSDRFGRRPVVLLSNFGLGCDYVLMALAPTLSWLFVGRVISGITAASIPTANAYIADVTPQDQRAAKFGMLGAAFGLGSHRWASPRRISRWLRPALSVLGVRDFEFSERSLRIVHFARVIAEGTKVGIQRKKCKSAGRIEAVALASGIGGARGGDVSHLQRTRIVAEHVCVIHRLSVSLGDAADRVGVHGSGSGVDGSVGGAHFARHQEPWGSTDAVPWMVVRVGRIHGARGGAEYADPVDQHSTAFTMGTRKSRNAVFDDAPSRQVGAGAAARRHDEHVRRRWNDCAARVHRSICGGDFAEVGNSSSRRTLLAGGVVDGGQFDDRVRRHTTWRRSSRS